jgi:hypothetical protein
MKKYFWRDGMSSLSLEDKIRFEKFYVKAGYLYIVGTDGVIYKRHKTISERLKNASDEDLKDYEILGNGVGVHWEKYDEDLSAAYLIYPEKFKGSKAA